MSRSRTHSEMVSFATLDHQRESVYANTDFSTVTFPEERHREAIIKKIFGVLNGVGWSATFVGSLTLTGIGTMGLGTPAIITMTAATMPPGTVFGFFYVNDDVNKEDQKEKDLIAKINFELQEAQKKQIELIKNLIKADDLLIEKLKALAKELNIANGENHDDLLLKLANSKTPTGFQKDFQCIVLLAQAIDQTISQLKTINVPLGMKTSRDQVINSQALNQDIRDLKVCFASYKKFIQQASSQQVLSAHESKRIAKKPQYISEVTPTETAPPTESGFFSGLKNFGKKVFSAGNTFGIGLGMGTIFCGIALAATPPGWVIGATIIGIIVTSTILGVAGHYLDVLLRAKQAVRVEELQLLQSNVSEYRKQQFEVGANLLKRVQKIKNLNEIEAAKNNQFTLAFKRETTPVAISAFPAALLTHEKTVPPTSTNLVQSSACKPV